MGATHSDGGRRGRFHLPRRKHAHTPEVVEESVEAGRTPVENLADYVAAQGLDVPDDLRPKPMTADAPTAEQPAIEAPIAEEGTPEAGAAEQSAAELPAAPVDDLWTEPDSDALAPPAAPDVRPRGLRRRRTAVISEQFGGPVDLAHEATGTMDSTEPAASAASEESTDRASHEEHPVSEESTTNERPEDHVWTAAELAAEGWTTEDLRGAGWTDAHLESIGWPLGDSAERTAPDDESPSEAAAAEPEAAVETPAEETPADEAAAADETPAEDVAATDETPAEPEAAPEPEPEPAATTRRPRRRSKKAEKAAEPVEQHDEPTLPGLESSDAPAEDSAAQETPAEEAAPEEAPAAETPAEETPTDETPGEESVTPATEAEAAVEEPEAEQAAEPEGDQAEAAAETEASPEPEAAAEAPAAEPETAEPETAEPETAEPETAEAPATEPETAAAPVEEPEAPAAEVTSEPEPAPEPAPVAAAPLTVSDLTPEEIERALELGESLSEILARKNATLAPASAAPQHVSSVSPATASSATGQAPAGAEPSPESSTSGTGGGDRGGDDSDDPDPAVAVAEPPAPTTSPVIAPEAPVEDIVPEPEPAPASTFDLEPEPWHEEPTSVLPPVTEEPAADIEPIASTGATPSATRMIASEAATETGADEIERVEYRPGNGRRFLFGGAFIAAAVLSVVAVFWAIQNPGIAPSITAGCLVVLTGALWWSLMAWSPRIIAIGHGVLEFSQGGHVERFNLLDPDTNIAVGPDPTSRAWRAEVIRSNGTKVIVRPDDVRPQQFSALVAKYREEAEASRP